MAFPQERTCTIDDIYALPEGQREELIDGQLIRNSRPDFGRVNGYFLA